MPKDIQVKNAVVTGGTDGIGREIAQGLARAGHRLILVGRDAEKGA
jgi:short-subunit dehydrogenase